MRRTCPIFCCTARRRQEEAHSPRPARCSPLQRVDSYLGSSHLSNDRARSKTACARAASRHWGVLCGEGPERHWTGDLAAVTVGGDRRHVLPPAGALRCISRVPSSAIHGARPRIAISTSSEVFGECLAHVGDPGSAGFGYEPGYKARWLACTAGIDGSVGGDGDAVVEDSGHAVGVPERVSTHKAGQEGAHCGGWPLRDAVRR